MPVDALPQPWPDQQPGSEHYSRTYRDLLGRPMQAGQVTITAEAGGAPVVVELVAGALDVDLPPGTYRLSAKLRTVDSFRVTETDTVTLGGTQ